MNIALLCGGFSSEREISFRSAESVAAAIKNDHALFFIDTGRMELFTDFPQQKSLPATSRSLSSLQHLLSLFIDKNIEFTLLMLHGGDGEDGHIQALCEMIDMPYSGTDMRSSVAGMDKVITKYIMDYHGIPTPRWAFVNRGESMNEMGIFDFPLIVKPSREGSTVGLTKVTKADELQKAVDLALSYDTTALIEEYIPGREFTVTVMNGEAYPIVEVCPKDGFYDYEHKYTKGKSDYICPAEIDEAIAQEITMDTLDLYRLMNLSGVVRFDVRMDGEDYYFLEANTLPGMTALSLVPMAFQANGISYSQLIMKMIDDGMNRTR